MIAEFTKLRGIEAGQVDEVLDAWTDEDWDRFELGYLDIAVHELRDWWGPMLGLTESVDCAALFCAIYRRSLARSQGV